jgi:hypothetical protein
MKKRTLIVTGACETNPPVNDDSIMSVLDISMKSKQSYAKKHNYDLICMRSFGSDSAGRYKDTDIGFLRVLRVFDFLNHYDRVMWIDADAIITNDSYKIEDFELTDQHIFYASHDWMAYNVYSTGNFIIQKTEKFEAFKNIFFDVSTHFKFKNEQDTMIALYRGNTVKSVMKMLHYKFLNSVPESNLWNWPKDRPPIITPWAKDSFLVHFTGVTNKDRLECIQKHFKDYI